jgi:hypothetical protein
MTKYLNSLILAGVCAFGMFACKHNQSEPVAKEEVKEPAPQASHDISHSAENASPQHVPPYYNDPNTVTLEPTLDPATVPPEAQEAYIVAKNNPKLLAQLPCFCYCDRFGHGSLQSCFVSDHATSCDICIKEALEAKQMQTQGMAPAEIRSVIISRYHPQS